jgi:hypothetical protein
MKNFGHIHKEIDSPMTLHGASGFVFLLFTKNGGKNLTCLPFNPEDHGAVQ